jgi:hypothetical protein
MNQAQQLLDALVKRYIAQKAEGVALLNLYANQSVGVGEHPQVIDEMDKALSKISDADEKIELITNMLKNGERQDEATK